ncbi:MAG: type IV conjugative transfer system lipoprotein TraV [Burkholderiaceae bacterium]|nr:type IV conjugative transfer system lipoprotein TraV [Burkholderiaceae bacterium]
MKICIHQTAVSGPLLCAAMVSMEVLTGCSSITGLDGSSQYACKAPEGVKCDSVSGNYYNAIQNNLPAQRKPTGTSSPASLSDPQGVPPVRGSSRSSASSIPTAVATAAGAAGSGVGSAYLAAPLRAGPRVLRLWIKPWEDADHDLNGESLVYVQVDNGRWLVEHVQRQAREPYAPIRPTRLPTSATKDSVPDARESDSRPASHQGLPTANDGSAVTQALRALHGRPAAAPGN